MLSGSNIPFMSVPGDRKLWSKPLPLRTGLRTRLYEMIKRIKPKTVN